MLSSARCVERLVERGHLQDMGPAEERVERRAQFVRQRREEFFLEAIGVLRVAIEQRVVEGECGTGGDIGGEGEIAIVV